MKKFILEELEFPDFFEAENENLILEKSMDFSLAPLQVGSYGNINKFLRILDIRHWFQTEADFLAFNQKMRKKHKDSRILIYIGFDTKTYPAYPVEIVLYEAINSLRGSNFDANRGRERARAALRRKQAS